MLIPSRWLRGPQVIISVGPEKVRYPLPKGRLVQDDVPFFKAAFTGSFEEAATNILELPNEEVQVFDLFVEWLMSGAVPMVPVSPEFHHISYERVSKAGMIEYEKPWHQLAHMAHKFCCTELEKKVFEVLETYHSLAGIVCHPNLLDLDYIHMPESAALEAFTLTQLKSLENESLEDYSLMLEFLGNKAPKVLVKAALAEQVKRIENREDEWGWGSLPSKKKKKKGND